MTGSPDEVVFRGSVRALATQMAAAVLPFAGATCLLLFGPIGWRFFLVFLAVLPGIGLLALVMAWADRLKFDAAAGVLRRRLRPPLRADEVVFVRCVESLGQVQVTARMRRRSAQLLLVALAARELPRLLEALERWCPEAEVRVSRYPVWKLIGATLGILGALYLFGVWYLEREHPGAAAECRRVSGGDSAGATVSRRLAGVRVRLPAELEAAQLAAAPAAAMESLGGAASFFLRVAGIGSEYELLHYACCARFGLVPRTLKTVLVAGPADVRLYEFRADPIAALAVVRPAGSGSSARLFLFNRDDGSGASLVLGTQQVLDENSLARLLPRASVQAAPGG